MTIRMNYDKATLFIETFGRDAFLELLQGMYPDYDLYKFSTDWLDNRKYGCKVRGTRGDLRITWLTDCDCEMCGAGYPKEDCLVD